MSRQNDEGIERETLYRSGNEKGDVTIEVSRSSGRPVPAVTFRFERASDGRVSFVHMSERHWDAIIATMVRARQWAAERGFDNDRRRQRQGDRS